MVFKDIKKTGRESTGNFYLESKKEERLKIATGWTIPATTPWDIAPGLRVPV